MIYLPTGPVTIEAIKKGEIPVPGAQPGAATQSPEDGSLANKPKPPGSGGGAVAAAPDGRKPKPNDKSALPDGSDVADDDDIDEPLNVRSKSKPKKNSGAVVKKGEVSARSARPFRKAWHGYPSVSVRSPKSEAAHARLVAASRDAGARDRAQRGEETS